MRLLADENIPAPLTRRLREDGHDVEAAVEIMASAGDEAILARAIGEQRVLLTFDGDFGRMIFSEGYRAPIGVIFIRKPPPSLYETVERVRQVVNGPAPSVDGFFVSIDRKARYHPLPLRNEQDNG